MSLKDQAFKSVIEVYKFRTFQADSAKHGAYHLTVTCLLFVDFCWLQSIQKVNAAKVILTLREPHVLKQFVEYINQILNLRVPGLFLQIGSSKLTHRPCNQHSLVIIRKL